MTAALSLLLAFAPAARAEPKLPASFIALPLVRQTTDYDCGAASLYSVLVYWRAYAGDETALFPLLHTTPKDGTDPQHLVLGAEHYGLTAGLSERMTIDDLRGALELGETVILDLQAWREKTAKPVAWKDDWDDGHYVVLAAMDQENAYVMDPSVDGGYAWLPINELLDRWHDFEDRAGAVVRYRRLGVVIRGANKHVGTPGRPSRLVRME